jgi:outer membrane protein OmpA-like peptidoglycan-associated protein
MRWIVEFSLKSEGETCMSRRRTRASLLSTAAALTLPVAALVGCHGAAPVKPAAPAMRTAPPPFAARRVLAQEEDELRARLPGLDARLIETADRLVLRAPARMLFGADEAELGSEAVPLLSAVAEVLRRHGATHADVVVYTDSIGGMAANRRLAEVRASAIVAALVAEGVPAAQLRAIGSGAAMPIESNSTPEGRERNRRVEIVLDPGAGAKF